MPEFTERRKSQCQHSAEFEQEVRSDLDTIKEQLRSAFDPEREDSVPNIRKRLSALEKLIYRGMGAIGLAAFIAGIWWHK